MTCSEPATCASAACKLPPYPRRFAACVLLALLVGCASAPVDLGRRPSSALPRPVASAVQGLVAQPAPPGASGIRLIPEGQPALRVRLELIAKATSSVDAQYFIVDNDAAGTAFVGALVQAARRGVRVRLLVDDMHTIGSESLLARLAREPNAEVRLFNPFGAGRGSLWLRMLAGLPDLKRLTRRMHNKLLIADSTLAVAGGRNIANEYFALQPADNFVDLDALLVGEVLPQLAAAFDRYWNSELSRPIAGVLDTARAATASDRASDAAAPSPADAPATPPSEIERELASGSLSFVWAPVSMHVDPPEKVLASSDDVAANPGLWYDVTAKMRSAHDDLLIVSPYFIPRLAGVAMLRDLRAQEVSVTILTNSLAATDEPLVHIPYARYRVPLLRSGVTIYESSPTRARRVRAYGPYGSFGRLHSKIAVIDRSTVFMGSMNFDPRSHLHNTEMCLEIESPELAQQVLRLVAEETDLWSYRVTLDAAGAVTWHETASDRTYRTEPETDALTRFLMQVAAPLIPEDLL